MPACWAINPIVQQGGVNVPLVETLLDGSGRQRFHHSSVIYPERGMTWCLSYVTTNEPDFSGLDAEPSVIRIFDEVLDNEIDGSSPAKSRHLAWLRNRHTSDVSNLNTRFALAGIGGEEIAANSTRNQIIAILGKAASNNDLSFNPEAWYTSGFRGVGS